MNTDFHISTDSFRLDIDMIYNYLSAKSYWAKGRTREKVTKSIENSLCFGVYITVRRWGLNTNDAHGLYEQFGFKKIDDPEIHMQRIVD